MLLKTSWDKLSWSFLASVLWHPAVKWSGFIYPLLGQFIIFRLSKEPTDNSPVSYTRLLDNSVSIEPILMYYGLLLLSFSVLIFSLFAPKIIKVYGTVEDLLLSGRKLGEIAPEYIPDSQIERTREGLIRDYWVKEEISKLKWKNAVRALVLVGALLIIISATIRVISVTYSIFNHYLF